MKTDYTLYIYKADARYKSGARLVSLTVWTGRDDESMQREVAELQRDLYPPGRGYTMEFHPLCF